MHHYTVTNLEQKKTFFYIVKCQLALLCDLLEEFSEEKKIRIFSQKLLFPILVELSGTAIPFHTRS
jgi:hypothetical protein